MVTSSLKISRNYWRKIGIIILGNFALSLMPTNNSLASHSEPFDYDHDKRTVMQLATAKLERRLQYWREKEQEEILKRYRLITSI
jgi:ribosomal protein S15P/S13E